MRDAPTTADSAIPRPAIHVYRISLECGVLRVSFLSDVPQACGGDARRPILTLRGREIGWEDRGAIGRWTKRTTEDSAIRNCRADIPLDFDGSARLEFSFPDGAVRTPPTMRFGPHVPVQNRVPRSYWHKGGWIVRPLGNGMEVRKSSFLFLAFVEFRREVAMFFGRAVSLLLWRWTRFLARPFLPKDIWLLSDRLERADDNAEAFFTWLRERRTEVHCHPVFVLSRKSPHWDRLRAIGPVVDTHGWRHKLLFLSASHIVTAYERAVYFDPFRDHARKVADMTAGQKRVYLGHGIVKGDMTKPLSQFKKDFHLLITSTRQEFEAFRDNRDYGFELEELALTGRPRYDFLRDCAERIVTVAPSWRSELFVVPEGGASPDCYLDLVPDFEKSEFCRFWRGFLHSTSLHAVAKRLGFRIQFLPHPRFFPYLERFRLDSRVAVLGANVRYREVFAESALLLTDWSSTAFDFAYMKKPVVYAQFDAERNYPEGYFDDEKEGFGEVEHTLDATIDRVIEYMENGCRMKPEYRARVDRFFTFTDQNNCRRVYEAVLARR